MIIYPFYKGFCLSKLQRSTPELTSCQCQSHSLPSTMQAPGRRPVTMAENPLVFVLMISPEILLTG